MLCHHIPSCHSEKQQLLSNEETSVLDKFQETNHALSSSNLVHQLHLDIFLIKRSKRNRSTDLDCIIQITYINTYTN